MKNVTENINLDAMIGTMELHLNSSPAFVREFGSLVKKCGGKYSACRGFKKTRYVFVPASETHLINLLVQRFGSNRTTMIARDVEQYDLPAWVEVQYVTTTSADPMADFHRLFRANLKIAHKRGLVLDHHLSAFLHQPEWATSPTLENLPYGTFVTMNGQHYIKCQTLEGDAFMPVPDLKAKVLIQPGASAEFKVVYVPGK